MDTESWQQVFRSIRPEEQDTLVVQTSAGLEVAVQNLARIEDQLIMIRGRVAGTADSGRLFLIPYDQLASIYVNREVDIMEVEIYSPSVPPERKAAVARMVAEAAERARAEADSIGREMSGGKAEGPKLEELESLRKQFDETKRIAAESAPKQIAGPTGPASTQPKPTGPMPSGPMPSGPRPSSVPAGPMPSGPVPSGSRPPSIPSGPVPGGARPMSQPPRFNVPKPPTKEEGGDGGS